MRYQAFIVFSDLKGFSKLGEEQVAAVQKTLFSPLSQKVARFMENGVALTWNTWGDAIFTAFTAGKDAVEFMLEYRDFFRTFNFETAGLPTLQPRIAGHFGEVEVFNDPLLGMINILGVNVNTAARIEPVTRAGEIFVTSEFKDAIEKLPTGKLNVKFEILGTIKLAKDFGERDVFRLARQKEPSQIIDKVIKHNLLSYLPDVGPSSEEEVERLKFYKTAPSIVSLQELVSRIDESISSPMFLLEVADLEKKRGLYTESLALVEYLEKYTIQVDGIAVYPLRHRVRLLQIKANVLTRLGRYEDASDVVYGLWQAGHHDAETLSMLAAQYKRRALYAGNMEFDPKAINYELLHRAKNLYLEAFRIEIDNYYPVINAAYLYKIIGGGETGKGTKLASYIVSAWGNNAGESWWLDATLAEAELLQDAYEEANAAFTESVKLHKPNVFEKQATLEQILLYSKVHNCEAEVAPIIDLLRM